MKRSKHGWFERTFKFDIVLVFSTLIVTTMATITAFTYVQNTKESLRLADRVMDQTAQAVIEKTIEYLTPAQTVAEMSAVLLARSGTDIGLGSQIHRFFESALASYPQIGLIYYGDERGNFSQVKRDITTRNLINRLIDRSQSTAQEFNVYRDKDGGISRQTVSQDIRYDPRIRPWYKGALEVAGAYWTDIYIFFVDRVPGITAAFGVRDAASGEPLGVVAADLTLAQLSTFLRELPISERGIAFIMDERGQLIAFPDKSTVITDKDDKVRPLLVSELKDPWITSAARAYQDSGSARFEFTYAGEKTIGFVADFPATFGKPWKTLVLVPVDDFLGPLKKNSMTTLAISLGILIVAVMLGLRFARNIARPVEHLTGELNSIRDFHLGERIEVNSYIREIQLMEEAINSMKNGLEAFRRYVPADLVRELIHSGQEAVPGGDERELTLLFSDIANFTRIAEEMPARELMVVLSDYLDVISRAIGAEQGTIDKYIGDSVMAFWGAPQAMEEHALHACRAALRAVRELDHFNAGLKARGSMPFHTRFGIHSGFTVVGNMGSSERLNYTALGDSVNLASRLEGVNKQYDTQVLLSQTTYRYVRNDFICRPIDMIAVKGKEIGVKIFELLGEAGDEDEQRLRSLAKRYAAAFELYLNRDWEEAVESLEALLMQHPGDRPAEVLLGRCKALVATPPGADWSGVWRLTEK